jgi:hypothetical protein
MLEGTFDYNKTPLAPPGTKVIIHEKPQQRKTWDPHGTEGWYLGPAMEHCRCHRVFTNKTKAERITDTVEFFPQHTTVPHMSTDDIAIQAAEDLIAAINQPITKKSICPIGNKQMEAIRQISDLYQQHTLNQRKPLRRVPPKQRASFPRVATQPNQQSTTNRETRRPHITIPHGSNRHQPTNKRIVLSPFRMTRIASQPHRFQLKFIGPMQLSIQTQVHRWNIDTCSKVPNIVKPGRHPLQMNLDDSRRW